MTPYTLRRSHQLLFRRRARRRWWSGWSRSATAKHPQRRWGHPHRRARHVHHTNAPNPCTPAREMSSDWVAHVAACIKAARPPEHRAWWDRRPTFGHRARSAAGASSTAGGVPSES